MSLRPDWVYMGDKAATASTLTADQEDYAITLRRQFAQSLATQASRHALANLGPDGREWTLIANACRNEVRRMERAHQRLAMRVHGGPA